MSVSIQFLDDVLLSRRLREFWMTSILGHVVCLDMLLLKKSFALVISSPPSSRIASLLFAIVMNAKFTNKRCTPHPLTYNLLLQLVLSPNGASTIWPVTLVFLGGMGILSLLWTISPNGPKWCLHTLRTVKWQLNSYWIMLFLGLECLKPLSPTMAPIFEITWWLSWPLCWACATMAQPRTNLRPMAKLKLWTKSS